MPHSPKHYIGSKFLRSSKFHNGCAKSPVMPRPRQNPVSHCVEAPLLLTRGLRIGVFSCPTVRGRDFDGAVRDAGKIDSDKGFG